MNWENRRPLRAGIVGLGHVAPNQIEALKRVDGVSLTAACDRDQVRRAVIPEDLPFFTEVDDFLAHSDLDLVIVSVPTTAHEQVAVQSLRAGRDVLIEKPIASDMAALERILATANSCGRTALSSFHAAFGREVLWFERTYLRYEARDFGPLTGFSCFFYDSYFSPAGLAKGARSLEGSWLDSSINALSVLARFVDMNTMKIEHSAMTRLPDTGASDLQGYAAFSFAPIPGRRDGWGSISTNWTLGVSAKVTRLSYGESGVSVLLDHTTERIVRIERSGEEETVGDFSDDVPRLTAHYIGVFKDLLEMKSDGRDNVALARCLHRLALGAYAG
jgi:predicted dehydrogenase